jgi:hypothetical protein
VLAQATIFAPSNEAFLRLFPEAILSRLLTDAASVTSPLQSLVLLQAVPSPVHLHVRTSHDQSICPPLLHLLSALHRRMPNLVMLQAYCAQDMTDGLKLPSFLSSATQLQQGSGLLMIHAVNKTASGMHILPSGKMCWVQNIAMQAGAAHLQVVSSAISQLLQLHQLSEYNQKGTSVWQVCWFKVQARQQQ